MQKERHRFVTGAVCVNACSHEIISQTKCIKSFSKSQFPRKSVNLIFILATIKDELTDLRGN